MSEGYSILIWDGYGAGLVKVNARLFEGGNDMYGNPTNWWPCEGGTTDEQILEKWGPYLHGVRYKVVRD